MRKKLLATLMPCIFVMTCLSNLGVFSKYEDDYHREVREKRECLESMNELDTFLKKDLKDCVEYSMYDRKLLLKCVGSQIFLECMRYYVIKEESIFNFVNRIRNCCDEKYKLDIYEVFDLRKLFELFKEMVQDLSI